MPNDILFHTYTYTTAFLSAYIFSFRFDIRYRTNQREIVA